jgi:hypothetical protein
VLLAIVGFSAARPQKDVEITRSEFDDQGDGTFSWLSELSDGSKKQQSGKLKQIGTEQGIELTGSYSYTSPEGEKIELTYIADENGFQPSGAHLPTPPTPSEAILKALEIIYRNAEHQSATYQRPAYVHAPAHHYQPRRHH